MAVRPITRTKRLVEKLAKNFLPPEKMTVSEWADKYRMLSSVGSAVAGHYRTAQTPYMREIMDSFSDPKVEKIFVVASSQIGKTEAELCLLGYIMDIDPCGVIFAVPTIKDAEDFSKERVAPMIDATPRLKKLFGKRKSRDSAQTIQQMMFSGGVLNIVGVNVPSQLASKPRRVVIGDEIDRWTDNCGGEGDPWGLLEARTLTFYNRKLVAVSTPLIKGASRIADHFETGTQEYWSYKCPKCGKYNHIVFKNIKFAHTDVITNGKKTIKVDWVKWQCPDCGELLTEQEIKRQPAKWVASNPPAIKNGIRSFWINGFCSPFPVATWDYIVWRFLEAGKDPAKLQLVFNTLFGELWEDRRDTATEDEMLKRREEYEAELPDGVLMLTCAVDTQDNRLEYEVKGWGFNKENWGIKRGFIMGRPDNPAVWTRLDDVLSHVYKFKSGKGLSIVLTLVDSGGHFTQEVYFNCMARMNRNVFPIKGYDRNDMALARPFTSPPKKQFFGDKKYWVALYTIGVNSGKRAVHDFMRVKESGAMYCHFPLDNSKGYDALYFNGLMSEVEIRKGNTAKWEKIAGHERNEPFDLFVYNYAALELIDPDMDSLYNRLHGINQQEQKPVTTVKPARKKVLRRDPFDKL